MTQRVVFDVQVVAREQGTYFFDAGDALAELADRLKFMASYIENLEVDLHKDYAGELEAEGVSVTLSIRVENEEVGS